MALYILDNTFRNDTIVEGYESYIWTERFSAYGDFELYIQSNPTNRARFTKGKYLGLDGSSRVMRIKTVEDSLTEEGKKVLKLSGPSLEQVLEERIARGNWSNLTQIPKWILEGKPAAIARKIFNDICVDGVLDERDKIPLIQLGSFLPPDSLPEPDLLVSMELEIASVYAVIKEICDAWDLGFRLIRNGNNQELYFNIYSGNDRTASQTGVAAVVFAESLNNLTNIKSLDSDVGYKNVAYVYSKLGTVVVYSPEAPSNVSGFDRNVLLVNVDDIGDLTAGPALQTFLTQRGQEELAKARKTAALDGQISQNGKYKYNEHYTLGDMVEMRNSDGGKKLLRVSEQIFVSDAQGDRQYPALTDILYLTPGSWGAWDFSQHWDEAEGTWSEK